MPGSRRPRKQPPPVFELTGTALKALGGPATIGPCGACRAPCEAAFLGPSVEALRFALDRGGKARGRPVVALRLRCVRCGKRMERRGTFDAPPEVAWTVFVASLAALGIPAGLEPDRAAAMPATPRPPMIPSRRDAGAPPIGVDEAIEAILMVRRARSWTELLAILGVPANL